MSERFLGIENVHEFYTEHYLSAILQSDIKPVIQSWREAHAAAKQEAEGTDSGAASQSSQGTPFARLGRHHLPFFRYRERLERARSTEVRARLHAEAWAEILDILSYPVAPDLRQLPSGIIPLLAQVTRADGSALVWALPVPSGVTALDGAEDMLEYTLADSSIAGSDLFPATDEERVWATGTVEAVVTEIFAQDEPPRFVLVLGDEDVVLADRGKWAEQRLLRFSLGEILGRRDLDTLQATAALLHRESLAPGEGTALVDALDQSSHKHAFAVSEDLKYALRECIELIGNEALRYRSEVSKKKIYGEEIDGDGLARECLRYMYRLLFLFYIEARPELGYAPIGSDAYRKGYSLERLRELERLEHLHTPEARDGYYVHECLKRLFSLVYEGTDHGPQEALLGATGVRADLGQDDLARSVHGTFEMAPLRSHLFDPERTQFLGKVPLCQRD